MKRSKTYSKARQLINAEDISVSYYKLSLDFAPTFEFALWFNCRFCFKPFYGLSSEYGSTLCVLVAKVVDTSI